MIRDQADAPAGHRPGALDENVDPDRAISSRDILVRGRRLNVPTPFLLLEAWRMLGRQAPLIDLDQCVNAIANRFYAIERSIVLDRTRNITIMHNQRCLAGNAGQRATDLNVVRVPARARGAARPANRRSGVRRPRSAHPASW